MPRKDVKVVRPIPILSIAGAFRPAGDGAVTGGDVVDISRVTQSVEGHLLIVRDDVVFPAAPGHHHMRRRSKDDIWRDLL